MARPLAAYLTSGSYDGIDIVRPSIEWCRRAYRPHPNFRFHHSDIYNQAYNASGIAAADYRFPFPDASFDFAFLTSVFTHMLPGDVAHYLNETARVLAPDGRVFITAFLLDDESRGAIDRGRTRLTFGNALDGCFVETADIPENAVAYRDAEFRAMVESAGLAVGDVRHGAWRGIDADAYQDILIASRRGGAAG
jgi:SAM-dependent methyltransferase